MKTGFTLHELIIVMVIAGILVAIGVPSYIGMQEDSHNREAISNLRRLQEAEKFYHVETTNSYYSSSNINNINTNLTVSLPYDPDPDYVPKWGYTVYSTGCVQATRNGNDGRNWYLPILGEEPIKVPPNGVPAGCS
ncbi:MAG: prepilin-type N-terminal cleavage/methylation domain-containing protein [Candidatus Omnitrophota bacterium]|nr:prepilin-type N-terminal cleavage/methylation domain-containing protein [Candidatus Omnitrophota bacterium]